MTAWFLKNKNALIKDLCDFLKFSSISADPKYKKEVFACANWLVIYLQKIGMDAEILKTSTYPLVFAQNKNYQKDKPTILIYGHYDVQPVDPLEEWKTNPFEPTIIDDNLYARGALDNKGQIFYAITALKAFLEEYRELPFNLKFCIEGEEESSSEGLLNSLDAYKETLKADYLLVIDFSVPEENTPFIVLGARGMVNLNVEFIGSTVDFHSGEFGGIAYNPLRAAVEVLAKLWDENGKITIPGFYDELKAFSFTNLYDHFDKQSYTDKFGIKAFHQEKGFSPLESNWFRPTIEINGLYGGYEGKGFKSVIPKKASCKLSARIVPGQEAKKIIQMLKEFLQKQTKKGIELKVDAKIGGNAIWADVNSKLTKIVTVAMEEVFEKPCKQVFCGGSVPVVGVMVEALKVQPTMIGLGLPSDNMHAPNEHFSLTRFKQGFLCITKVLHAFGRKEKDANSHN